ncbi:MAG TPA: hypothetical protein DCK95_04255 [Anaerolineaceae bacterium]|uniref:Uncharacterized protein n=1 Tax=Anaerolinea thermophila TaxID=167964 RepID=A0A117LH37_9CHLR|nr:MAG: hypothetical protein XD73_0352 [Anaerolinea thermophila]HAF61518.1 hypothetical protein [Anaerolineaceae bacterium]
MSKEGVNSQQFEEDLRSKFVQVKPDDSFIRNLSARLFPQNRTSLEKSEKFFYYLALILFGVFSGLFIWWFIKKIFIHSKDK